MIEHTNLRPEATPSQIGQLCDEAREFCFAAVVVNPCYVSLAAPKLKDSGVRLVSVVGFPLGANLSRVKQLEAAEALRCGAREIDMVLNIGALKAPDLTLVEADIRAVAETVSAHQAVLKAILETGLLTDDEKVAACRVSVKAGAAFVKTSTGFLGLGATAEDVGLLRGVVGPEIGVKASGGIKTLVQAKQMIAAGANRIGTSSGVAIIRELRRSAAE